MATMITRTVKTYRATIVTIGKDENGNLTVITGDSVEYQAPSPNDGKARAACKAAGIAAPRGTKFDHVLVGEVTYGMPVEDFMRMATPVEG